MTSQEISIHRTHCCKRHGCKYGHPDCPVVQSLVIQEYPCEECSWDSETPLEQKIDALECALRDIALYLGVGGFNSETVDPQKFFENIKWGIDNYAQSYHQLQKDLERNHS